MCNNDCSDSDYDYTLKEVFTHLKLTADDYSHNSEICILCNYIEKMENEYDVFVEVRKTMKKKCSKCLQEIEVSKENPYGLYFCSEECQKAYKESTGVDGDY